MMAGKFYAVRVGRVPGIYLSWDECKKNVDGFSAPVYKSFKTRAEAEAFMKNTAGSVGNRSSTIVKGNVKIVASKVSKIEFEDYENDALSMKKPKGWEVTFGGDGMFYTISVYDKENPINKIYLMLKIQPLLKSDSAKKAWQNYAGFGRIRSKGDQALFGGRSTQEMKENSVRYLRHFEMRLGKATIA